MVFPWEQDKDTEVPPWPPKRKRLQRDPETGELGTVDVTEPLPPEMEDLPQWAKPGGQPPPLKTGVDGGDGLVVSQTGGPLEEAPPELQEYLREKEEAAAEEESIKQERLKLIEEEEARKRGELEQLYGYDEGAV